MRIQSFFFSRKGLPAEGLPIRRGGNQKSAVFFLLDLHENEKPKNYIQKHIKFG
jgi:hypothetical protein